MRNGVSIAFVTGAGRGIGRAISLALARNGADLILASRTAHRLEETASLVRDMGRAALCVVTDVSRRVEVQAAVAAGLARFGQIDILVNNAALQPPIGPLAENDPDEWTRTVRTNLFGTFYCIKEVLPSMLARRRGKIVNLAGGGATSPRPNFSAYAASKAAVVRLTETLAEELRQSGIQVNAVAPGVLSDKAAHGAAPAEAADRPGAAEARPGRSRPGASAELTAELVSWLASDRSGNLTGKLISAALDDWRHWTPADLAALADSPWLTMRRFDPANLAPVTPSVPD